MAVLNFKGKSFVQNHHLLVKYHQLIPRKDQSLTQKGMRIYPDLCYETRILNGGYQI